MRRALWFIGVPLAAFAGGIIGSAPVYVMGLVVSVSLVGPLALLTGSLLATLSAGWVANLASFVGNDASARTRSRLPPIFGVSLPAAVVAFLLGFATAGLVNALELYPTLAVTLLVYLPGTVVFSAVTTAATWRLRAPAEGGLGFAGAAALALSAAWVVLSALLGGVVPVGFATGLPTGAVVFGVSLILAALGTLLATRRPSRGPEGRGLGRDAALSLALTGLMPAVIAGTIHLGCSVTYCGA